MPCHGPGRPAGQPQGPARQDREIVRELDRLAQVQEQIVEIERERDQAPTPCVATERKRHQLQRLNGIGEVSAPVLAREVYYRQFANRRQVGSDLGMTPSACDSGDSRRSHGISKAGDSLARTVMIQVAWMWIKHRPESELTKWFRRRTEGQSKRMRRVMIVALARHRRTQGDRRATIPLQRSILQRAPGFMTVS